MEIFIFNYNKTILRIILNYHNYIKIFMKYFKFIIRYILDILLWIKYGKQIKY
jgi:hypothetical protein